MGLTQSQVIKQFREVHGDKYDYSLVKYEKSKSKILIICPTHGGFKQAPYHHKRGQDCPECGKLKIGVKKKKSQSKVIENFHRVHGNTYDYSKVKYTKAANKISIICEEHGEFQQTANNHLSGQGCPECGKIKSKAPKLSQEEAIAKFKKIHNNKYDYSKVIYKGTRHKIIIICPEHGEFEQSAGPHSRGRGCYLCRSKAIGDALRKGQEQAIQEMIEVHGNTYDYSKVKYKTAVKKVIIICSIHGEFKQTPWNHVKGHGCPACANQISAAETSIGDFLEATGISVIRRDRDILEGKELDILMPELNLAIEYNGLIWHSEKYKKDARNHMLYKTKKCKEKGIRLIHINSNEDPFVVKKTLAVITGINKKRIFARKCKIVILPGEIVKLFLESNHIQGYPNTYKNNYGLEYEGTLVGVMLFTSPSSVRGTKKSATTWELRRYAATCRVVGGASRLLKAFLREHPQCEKVVSYSENRWFTGGMYEALGFSLISTSPPDYGYIGPGEAYLHKSNFKHSSMKKRKNFNYSPDLSEGENCLNNSWYKVWDCGKKKWELTLRPQRHPENDIV